MKKCFKCGLEKELDDFYVHPRMADGHLNKCKECTKKDAKVVYKNIQANPERAFKERRRCAKKTERARKEKKFWTQREYIKQHLSDDFDEKYPEKRKAHTATQHNTVKGFHQHHWSYNEDHFLDCIYLTQSDHIQIHRYINYDQERKQYRRLDGILLDTKQESMQYYAYVLGLNPSDYPDFKFFDKNKHSMFLTQPAKEND